MAICTESALRWANGCGTAALALAKAASHCFVREMASAIEPLLTGGVRPLVDLVLRAGEGEADAGVELGALGEAPARRRMGWPPAGSS